MWRLRTIIVSEVVIDPSEVQLANITLKIFEINEENTKQGAQASANMRYCDAFLRKETSDIFDAYAQLYNELNIALDQLSLVSYGTVELKHIVSIAPRYVKQSETFEIAFPQVSSHRKTSSFGLQAIASGSHLIPEQQRWCRLFRLGLNAVSGEEKFISFFSLLEEIARKESEEYIIQRCDCCKNEINTGRKATNNYILNMLGDHNLDQELIKQVAQTRNKIAHGSGTKNKQFYATLAGLNSHFEEICLLELEARLNLNVLNRSNVHIIDQAIIKHTCVCNNNGFDLVNSQQTLPLRFVNLKPNPNVSTEGQSVSAGFPLDEAQRPIIDPFSWPDILNV